MSEPRAKSPADRPGQLLQQPAHSPPALAMDSCHATPSFSGPTPSGACDKAPDRFDFLTPAKGPNELGWLAHYRVLRLLGHGGMGLVFQAEDQQLQRPVALKVLRPELALDPESRLRFLREARAAASLKHDHIITIYHVGQETSVCFLAMEYLEGESLRHWLDRGCRPTLPQSLRLAREIAQGLAVAHERNLIHRDIKPDNIWLEAPRGRVKILDFGLARILSEDMNLTQPGVVVGTPAYMSPEQAQGQPVNVRSDLFSLGCILYQLLTGQRPFRGENSLAIMVALVHDHPPPLHLVQPKAPLALVELMGKLLAKHPDGRPASAKAVVESIQAIERQMAFAGAPLSLPVAQPVPVARLVPEGPVASPVPGFSGEASPVPGSDSGNLTQAIGPRPATVGGIEKESSTITPTRQLAPVLPVQPRRVRVAWWAVPTAGVIAGLLLAAVLVLAFRSREGRVASASTRAGGPTSGTPSQGKGPVATQGKTEKKPTDDAWIKTVAAMKPEDQIKAVLQELKRRNPRFTEAKLDYMLKDREIDYLRIPSDYVTDLTPVRALPYLRYLKCLGERDTYSGQLVDLSPLAGLQIKRLEIHSNPRLTDLRPLQGMPLEFLNVCTTGVSDLKPLAGMPLRTLWITDTKVRDLAPLRDVPLYHLTVTRAPIRDLSPVADLKLGIIDVRGCPVDDLSPIRGQPIFELNGDLRAWRDAPHLRTLPQLRNINGKAAADFWAEADAKIVQLETWIQKTATLDTQAQVQAVGAKLRELNPGFTGDISLMAENGRMAECKFWSAEVADLTPLRALPHLRRLTVAGTAIHRSRLRDLSPLKGLPLEQLDCSHTEVWDLRPLRGMPLRALNVAGTNGDDLKPLQSLALTSLHCDFQPARDTEALRSMRTLQTINGKPVAQFWKEMGPAKP